MQRSNGLVIHKTKEEEDSSGWFFFILCFVCVVRATAGCKSHRASAGSFRGGHTERKRNRHGMREGEGERKTAVLVVLFFPPSPPSATHPSGHNNRTRHRRAVVVGHRVPGEKERMWTGQYRTQPPRAGKEQQELL